LEWEGSMEFRLSDAPARVDVTRFPIPNIRRI
jgi:hypothetical protein